MHACSDRAGRLPFRVYCSRQDQDSLASPAKDADAPDQDQGTEKTAAVGPIRVSVRNEAGEKFQVKKLPFRVRSRTKSLFSSQNFLDQF